MAAVAHERAPAAARVLVGGLGLGFTLAEVLARFAHGALVEVAELMPVLIDWHAGPLAALTGAPLADPRVRVLCEDVRETLARGKGAYDVVLLDVDNGPAALTQPGNGALYTARGIALCRDALRPGGVLVVWSRGPAPGYAALLERAGLLVDALPARAHAGRGARHVLLVAQR
jgi:spermidine synthase